MKAKIAAGAEIDTLNREELREELSAWRAEIGRGVKFRKSSVSTVQSATFRFTTGDRKDTEIGPNAGMVLALTRLWVSGNGFNAGTDLFSIYLNSIIPASLIASGLTRGKDWDVGVLTLVGADRLFVDGAAAAGAVGDQVVVSWAGIELPEQLAWMLL